MANKKKSNNERAAAQEPPNGLINGGTSIAAGPPRPVAHNLPTEQNSSPKVRATPALTTVPAPASSPALIICRNKHWRYISAFHGPWLQLPPEILETLAHANYNVPRPRPIDPAAFFELVKIRRLVDDATTLAVRAANGVVSSGQSSSPHAAASLLGFDLGSGPPTKLSRERRHRMREQATQKLSRAYHLDEIACSVATMQSASALEDVASIVLQRTVEDADAKYVHFFHEKIPSRQLAESTSLQPLDDVVRDRPTEPEPLRTRATVKVFKEDYESAVVDLTAALQMHKLHSHQAAPPSPSQSQSQEVLQVYDAKQVRSRRRQEDIVLREDEQPSSLECQLLFHRAGVYLNIACRHVDDSLSGVTTQNTVGSTGGKSREDQSGLPADNSPPEAEFAALSLAAQAAQEAAQRRQLDARKLVRANAKRALRDYMAFLSHFDYSPDHPVVISEDFARKVHQAANGVRLARQHLPTKVQSPSARQQPNATTTVRTPDGHHGPDSPSGNSSTMVDTHTVYALSELFNATAPRDLPPYPSTEGDGRPGFGQPLTKEGTMEAVTYHPLLTDALHSLLLCHCLMQTSAKELLRHAYMVGRLARLTDGYPVFQASRSPARADWIEVLRRGENWVQLSGTWETLCAPAPLALFQPHVSKAWLTEAAVEGTPNGVAPKSVTNGVSRVASPSDPQPGFLPPSATTTGQGSGPNDVDGNMTFTGPALAKETDAQHQERLRSQAILDALDDDRVTDEASFRAAIRARQQRAGEGSRTDGAVNALDGKLAQHRDTVQAAAGATAAVIDSRIKNGGTTNGVAAAKARGALDGSLNPKRWAVDDGKEYPILTERAAAIARWVREAPPNVASGGSGAGNRTKRKKKPAGKPPAMAEPDDEGALDDY